MEQQQQQQKQQQQKQQQQKQQQQTYPTGWVCYIIKSENPQHKNRTYVGATNDLHHRLRQHNGVIKGGAKYTQGKGPWVLVCCVAGFPDRSTVINAFNNSEEEEKVPALQFEWRMHHPVGTYRIVKSRKRKATSSSSSSSASTTSTTTKTPPNIRMKKTKKRAGGGLQARMDQLERTLNMEQWTSLSPKSNTMTLRVCWYYQCRPAEFKANGCQEEHFYS